MENDIASKYRAGEYALNYVSPLYAPIIKEAMEIRKGSGHRNYTSVLKRRQDSISYIDYMIDECNRVFRRDSTSV